MRISLILFLLFCASILAQEEDRNRNNLVSAATTSVTIGGNFVVTGSFPSYLNERVDQFVTRIYNQAKENAVSGITEAAIKTEIEKEFNKYTFRNIKLKRISGEELTLDLLKFRRTGDFSHNPYLRHDDVLIFPPTDIERNFITISGAVMLPSKFHYMEGDRLSDIIELAGGENKAYEEVQAKIYRSDYSGTKTEEIIVPEGDNPVLQRGDRVVLDAEETSKKEFNMLVIGEVGNPGTIPISKSNTTLKEVIDRAGGLKKTAFLKNSKLYTGSRAEFVLNNIYGMKLDENPNLVEIQQRLTTELFQLEKIKMYRLSGMDYEDTAFFSMENQYRILTEGSSIDFSKVESESELNSFLVKDGDILVIPQKPTTIYLFGTVVNPGHVSYVEGKKAGYYIEKSGGLGERAEDDDIMVIKGSTREWISVEEFDPVLEEGDYIYVPRNEPLPINYYIDVSARYFGILGSIATVVLLFVEFKKN